MVGRPPGGQNGPSSEARSTPWGGLSRVDSGNPQASLCGPRAAWVSPRSEWVLARVQLMCPPPALSVVLRRRAVSGQPGRGHSCPSLQRLGRWGHRHVPASHTASKGARPSGGRPRAAMDMPPGGQPGTEGLIPLSTLLPRGPGPGHLVVSGDRPFQPLAGFPGVAGAGESGATSGVTGEKGSSRPCASDCAA